MAAQRENDQEVTDRGGEAAGGAKKLAGEAGDTAKSVTGEITKTLRGELRGVVRDAALEVLTPVARKATTTAAKYAVTKGPELFKDVVASRVREAGGPLAMAKGLTSVAGGIGQKLPKLGGGGGDGGGDGGATPSGTGRGRRLPVMEQVDVAVPVEVAYDQWTQFEEFPKFFRGVERVEQRDDKSLVWTERLWGVRRSWVSEITEQRPDERIAWHSTSGPKQAGVVTFHKLSDRLTRVQVTLDHQPTGLFERTASGMRYTRRALESDLRRFKALVEMSEEPSGAWRGRIEEGEVRAEGDQEGDQERAEGDQERAEDREDLEEAEPEGDEDEERGQARDEEPEEPEEPQQDEQPEEEVASAPRRRRSRDRYEEDEEAADDERPRPRRRASASRR